MIIATKANVKEGQYFRLVFEDDSINRYAYQVVECWSGSMSVKCKGGIMSKPYSEFKLVEDITGVKEVYQAPYFEDNRKSKMAIV